MNLNKEYHAYKLINHVGFLMHKSETQGNPPYDLPSVCITRILNVLMQT
jgi:hypothetical protein